MQVKFKKLHKNAVTPSYSREGDGALDLTAISKETSAHYEEMDTGIALEIPKGYLGLVLPRSSITNKGVYLGNSIGLIDSNFRNSIKFRFKKVHDEKTYSEQSYGIGDRVGQIIILPYPKIELVEVDNLSDSERGTNGWGSSGS